MSIEKAYDNWSSQYDINKNRTRDLDQLATIKMLKNLDFEKVLELGCGTGKNTEFLTLKASQVVAVDFSEEMLAIARKKYLSEKITFVKADINFDWNWTRENFDLITSNLVLEHIKDLALVFEKAFNRLAPGGWFYISELHPFKQYQGTKARYEEAGVKMELESFTHHISDFIEPALKLGFSLQGSREFFDEDYKIPRLLTFLFQKPELI